MKKLEEAITLIALIVTIIIILILSAVSITAIRGDGLIGKSREAAFRTEMATVRENLDSNNFTIEGDGINLENFVSITVAEANEWEISLKKELAYWGSFEYDVNKLTDNYIEKNFATMLSTTGENVKDIYYIKSTNKKYIYNAQNDIVYKVKPTRIYNNKVHSVEELDYILNGGSRTKSKNYTPISYEAQIVEVNELKYYEPNLNGYTQENTSLVFYKVEGDTITDTTYEMPVKEWLESGRQNTITREDGTYYLYDYSIKLWANIKIVNDTIETNWVWIPRYAFKNEETSSQVTFIDINNNESDGTALSTEYKVPNIFENNNKKGFWISKYDPTSVSRKQSTEFAYYIPNVKGFDKENTYLEIYDKETDQFVKEEKLANINNLTQFSKNNCWFDYDNNIWANIKIVKNGIETWWVWIPRYAFRIEGTSTEVIFIDTYNNPIDGTDLPSGYSIPNVFKDNNKKGFWISKYDPTNK